ncbi:MAG: hypothetical protein COV46_00315 [Deltaproteobacteria bacterium CG11_big_fil_rev_8_21_14_0_20_49_13]|nr:MAG: hypothetical protein COV46_00315 [Deltaproteobacteria bacterium CG11_big_fil_rev_8_21_14_0_20_49_13]
MNRNFLIAILISVAIHIVAISFSIYCNRPGDEPFGDGILSVELVGNGGDEGIDKDPQNTPNATKRVGPLEGGMEIKAAKSAKTTHYKDVAEGFSSKMAPSSAHSTGSLGTDGTKDTDTLTGPATAVGKPGLGAGTMSGNPILSRIRNKIERSKYYPLEARKKKIMGRSVVSFKIKEDGKVEEAALKESSGVELLDNAALETLKRAEPLPFYKEPLTIAIKFEVQ